MGYLNEMIRTLKCQVYIMTLDIDINEFCAASSTISLRNKNCPGDWENLRYASL